MNKRANKKAHILQTGLELMKLRGYNGTSVKDIVDAAGVPKGSFYNYFASKESFALDALDAVAAEEQRLSEEMLSAKAGSPSARLQGFFQQVAQHYCDGNFRQGCFCGNLAQEMSDSNDVIRAKVEDLLNRKTRLIVQLLDEARAAGEIESELPSQRLADFILNAWEGTLIRMKATRSREPLDVFLQTLPQLTG